MTTVSDVVEATLRRLHSGQREEINKLNASITASATSLVTTYDLGGIRTGADVEIDTEIFYVWDSSDGTKTVTVQPGMRGSTSASHSAGALITVNPKFPRFSVLQAINEELVDLSSPMNGLFKVTSLDLTYNPSTVGYNLTGATNVSDVLEVRYENPGMTGDWRVLKGWKLDRNMSTTDFASGFALFVTEGGSPGSTMRVNYKTPFTAVSSLSQDINTVSGISAEATDIVSLGAAIRLMAPREIKRSFTEAQDDARRADEVPAGATLQSYRGLMALRDERIKAEAARLLQQFPVRRWG